MFIRQPDIYVIAFLPTLFGLQIVVHLDCYRSVRSASGPWHCELCEDLVSSRGSGAMATNSLEKPYFVAECGLCGGTAGAFRKSVGGQWIHALCAEVNYSPLSAVLIYCYHSSQSLCFLFFNLNVVGVRVNIQKGASRSH